MKKIQILAGGGIVFLVIGADSWASSRYAPAISFWLTSVVCFLGAFEAWKSRNNQISKPNTAVAQDSLQFRSRDKGIFREKGPLITMIIAWPICWIVGLWLRWNTILKFDHKSRVILFIVYAIGFTAGIIFLFRKYKGIAEKKSNEDK